MANRSTIKKGGTVELKSVADLVGDLIHPAEIAAASKPLATAKPAPVLSLSPYSRNSEGQPLAANEADDFWRTFRARIDECDNLINRLCGLRGDDDDYRADLLATRKRTAPQTVITDIAYLKREIASLTPVTQSRGRCIDCEHFARVGLTGERCAHPDRSPPTEPPRADCVPAHQCEKFIHWRASGAYAAESGL